MQQQVICLMPGLNIRIAWWIGIAWWIVWESSQTAPPSGISPAASGQLQSESQRPAQTRKPQANSNTASFKGIMFKRTAEKRPLKKIPFRYIFKINLWDIPFGAYILMDKILNLSQVLIATCWVWHGVDETCIVLKSLWFSVGPFSKQMFCLVIGGSRACSQKQFVHIVRMLLLSKLSFKGISVKGISFKGIF